MGNWQKEKPAEAFEDLVGQDAVRAFLESEVRIRKNKELQELLGWKAGKSLLFYGAPGTGKTTMAKAFAHALMENGYRFLSVSPCDVRQSIVGAAEETIKAVFQEAMNGAPCVLLIDGLDEVCVDRRDPNTKASEKMLTIVFLEAYSDLCVSGAPVVLLGVTNRLEAVDPALTSKMYKVEFSLPDAAVRERYFARELQDLPLEEGLTFAEMAEKTEGYSFRALHSLCENLREAEKAEPVLSRKRFESGTAQ